MRDSSRQVSPSRVHKMRFGAEVTKYGTRFKIWAPKCKHIRLKLKGRRTPNALDRQDDGWHRKEVEGIAAGALYQFLLPDGTAIADPASRHQAADIDRYSEVIDPSSYVWHQQAVIYELHVAAFTPEGTFAAAARHLDHLARLGITAIQLMPLADCYGSTLRINLCDQTHDAVGEIVGRQICLQGFVASGQLGSWTVLWTISVGEV